MQFALNMVLATALCGLFGCGGDPTGPDGMNPGDDGLAQLPADTGGVHLALPREPENPDAPPYGTYLYLPADFETSPVPYPLLVFLHGAGERGDSADDPGTLDLLLRTGPPRLIDRDRWQPPHPMIVVAPQCHEGGWNPALVRELIAWVDRTRPVDRSRIYLTGLSMGGFGTWNYLGRYGAVAGDSLAVAAAAPICGGGNAGQAAAMTGTPLWAFHGTADRTVSPAGSVTMIKAVGALAPAVAPRLTLYDGVGHDSWSRTYDLSGLGQGLAVYGSDPEVEPWLTAYGPGLYDWFFSHHR